MPPKSHATRQKTESLGIPTTLPDTGALFVNSDIINALSAELLKCSGLHEAAISLLPGVLRKYTEVNPRLPLIQEQSIKNKMMRLFEQFKQYASNKMKAVAARKFKEKLPRLFDIIFCQCNIYRSYLFQ